MSRIGAKDGKFECNSVPGGGLLANEGMGGREGAMLPHSGYVSVGPRESSYHMFWFLVR